MSVPVDAGVAAELLEHAGRGDAVAVTRMIADLLDGGSSVSEVIEVVVAAQREVGERWQRAEWTVADEHVATAAAVAAVEALADAVPPMVREGAVVVACAEGDWHSLPSRFFAELLRDQGWGVRFLGASTPAADLDRYLSRNEADALIVSCTVPVYFGGVARLAEVAHRHRTPVLAGGGAFARNPVRALRLGADDVAATVEEAVVVLRRWQAHGGGLSLGEPWLDPLGLELDAAAPAVAAGAFESLLATSPTVRAYDQRQRDHTRDDLEQIVRFLAASQLVGDASVFTDFVAWLQEVLEARGVPVDAIHAGLRALVPGVDAIDPDAGDLLRAASRHRS